MKKNTLARIAITLLIFHALCFLWQGLEMAVYGAIQPRVVDDIMMMIMLPFIHIAVSFVYEQIKAYRNAKKSGISINISFNNREPDEINVIHDEKD